MGTNREEVSALVIRLRLYIANGKDFKTEEERGIYAGMPLNLSYDSVRKIVRKYPQIKHLSKNSVIKELKQKNFEMYIVAMSDIIYDEYIELKKYSESGSK